MKRMMGINGVCEETCKYEANKIRIRLNLLQSEYKKKLANTTHPNLYQS
jgi:hypothetical protein